MLGLQWDLEYSQDCLGTGIYPELLGDWDIPRTAWGLEYPPGQLGGWDILVIWVPGSTSGSFGMLFLPRSTLQGSVSLSYSLSLLREFWF